MVNIEQKEQTEMNEHQLVQTEQASVPQAHPHAVNPAQMLAVAVEQGADLEKLEKLMDLQERWEAKEAKKSYMSAMSKFRRDCPTITRTRSGHNNKYAGLAESISEIQSLMADCGLSHSWRTDQQDQKITVTCTVTHMDGHSESTALFAVADTTGSKNSIQAIGSTVSYLERYTLYACLGLASAESDDDGIAADPENTVAKQLERLMAHNEVLRDNLLSVMTIKDGIHNKEYSTAYEAWGELTEEEQRALWVAVTKGGVFTTEERKIMKSKEFNQS